MSPHVSCAPQGAGRPSDGTVDPSDVPWTVGEPAEASDEDGALPPEPESWSEAELLHLAQDFIARSEPLIDAVAPPAGEDEDDLFDGEMFDDERAEYQARSTVNPSPADKADIARQLMAREAARYPGCSSGFLVALALTYRRILLDRGADPRDKVEILRRVYSDHQPEWMTAEIVYLHFVLLDQCRYLARPGANLERKEETLRWVFTDPELEDRPFSFRNCVRLATGNVPDFGAVYRRLKEAMRPALAAWIRESLSRQRAADDRQSELFDG